MDGFQPGHDELSTEASVRAIADQFAIFTLCGPEVSKDQVLTEDVLALLLYRIGEAFGDPGRHYCEDPPDSSPWHNRPRHGGWQLLDPQRPFRPREFSRCCS